MAEEEKAELYYKLRGKELVDMLFDKELLHPDLSRDGMDAVEDFVAWMYQSQCETKDKHISCVCVHRGSSRVGGSIGKA